MGRPAIDISGLTYGRLTVVERAPRPSHVKRQPAYWRCACECGAVTVVAGAALRKGHTTSCGCWNREAASERYATIGSAGRGRAQSHGHHVGGRPSRTYHSWLAMKKRCHYPAHPAFPIYGGRGVTVCSRWRDSFEHFLADMGERPDGRTLDRIDPYGNYEPGNCRWATPVEQRANQRQISR